MKLLYEPVAVRRDYKKDSSCPMPQIGDTPLGRLSREGEGSPAESKYPNNKDFSHHAAASAGARENYFKGAKVCKENDGQTFCLPFFARY